MPAIAALEDIRGRFLFEAAAKTAFFAVAIVLLQGVSFQNFVCQGAMVLKLTTYRKYCAPKLNKPFIIEDFSKYNHIQRN